jgi:hypothetical protein
MPEWLISIILITIITNIIVIILWGALIVLTSVGIDIMHGFFFNSSFVISENLADFSTQKKRKKKGKLVEFSTRKNQIFFFFFPQNFPIFMV